MAECIGTSFETRGRGVNPLTPTIGDLLNETANAAVRGSGEMGRLRQGSIAKRAAIGVLAIYALLLQSFLVATMPAGAVASQGGINCAANGSEPGVPGGGSAEHHHCPCCILGCGAAAYTCAGAASAVVVFPRAASKIDFSPAPAQTARAPRKYYFAARGPPQDF